MKTDTQREHPPAQPVRSSHPDKKVCYVIPQKLKTLQRHLFGTGYLPVTLEGGRKTKLQATMRLRQQMRDFLKTTDGKVLLHAGKTVELGEADESEGSRLALRQNNTVTMQ
jgi:hypothetical protein